MSSSKEGIHLLPWSGSASPGRSPRSWPARCSSSQGNESLQSASENPAVTLEEPSPEAHRCAVRVEGLSVTYRTAVESKPTLKKTLIRLGRRERIIREIR